MPYKSLAIAFAVIGTQAVRIEQHSLGGNDLAQTKASWDFEDLEKIGLSVFAQTEVGIGMSPE